MEERADPKEITDEMIKEAIDKNYDRFEFSNRWSLSTQRLKEFYDRVFVHLRKWMEVTERKAGMSLKVFDADDEGDPVISKQELFLGVKKLFGIFPDKKGRLPNFKIYDSLDFKVPKPQYLGKNKNGEKLYAPVNQGDDASRAKSYTPRPRSPECWKPEDKNRYNKNAPEQERRFSEEALMRFATDQGLLKNNPNNRGNDFTSMMSMMSGRGSRGYGGPGFGSYSTNLLNEDGSLNRFGLLGNLGEDGLGMGCDRIFGNTIIPNLYEVPKKEIRSSMKHYGGPKQKGVWALGWRNPGTPDGITPSFGSFGTRGESE